jgi:hypothetical protein
VSRDKTALPVRVDGLVDDHLAVPHVGREPIQDQLLVVQLRLDWTQVRDIHHQTLPRPR